MIVHRGMGLNTLRRSISSLTQFSVRPTQRQQNKA